MIKRKKKNNSNRNSKDITHIDAMKDNSCISPILINKEFEAPEK